jgi:endonuclease/exonuclease/phosphatase family metal-dependent hydrolase
MTRFPTGSPTRRLASVVPAAALVVALLPACGGDGDVGPEPRIALTVDASLMDELPTFGTPGTLDIATWNIEWFGDRGNGPEDEDLQLANVGRILDGLAVDLWAVEEVTSATRFQTLVDGLDGYSGLLANDPDVVGGSAYYSDFNDAEQKVGLVYRNDLFTVDSARVILGSDNYAFAGRPPLLVHLSLAQDAVPGGQLAIVVLHAKAGAGIDDRTRRRTGADALKAYLDLRYPDSPVLVIGDFNDDIDTSIASGPSPYAAFVHDPGYRFITEALSDAGVSSTVFFTDMIDHQLATDELAAVYVAGSIAVVPADDYVDAYHESTSDHFPVAARFGLGTPTASDDPIGRASLRWSGATTDRVDVYRDGALLRTTANDGRYLDETWVDTGSVVYRICEAGTTQCSADATAAF